VVCVAFVTPPTLAVTIVGPWIREKAYIVACPFTSSGTVICELSFVNSPLGAILNVTVELKETTLEPPWNCIVLVVTPSAGALSDVVVRVTSDGLICTLLTGVEMGGV
jgi:hypothetical protein